MKDFKGKKANSMTPIENPQIPHEPYLQKNLPQKKFPVLSPLIQCLEAITKEMARKYTEASQDCYCIQQTVQEMRDQLQHIEDMQQKSTAAVQLCRETKRKPLEYGKGPRHEKIEGISRDPNYQVKLNDTETSDVILECDAYYFYVHRELLMKDSRYFKLLLQTPLREVQHIKAGSPIPIKIVSANTLATVLIYLYRGAAYIRENLCDLIYGAEYLQITQLSEQLYAILERKLDYPTSILSYAIRLYPWPNRSIQDLFIFLIEKPASNLPQTDQFIHLPKGMVLEILSSKKIDATEETLCGAAIRWIQTHNETLTQEDKNTLLDSVNFEIMSPNQLWRITNLTNLLPLDRINELCVSYATRASKSSKKDCPRLQRYTDELGVSVLPHSTFSDNTLTRWCLKFKKHHTLVWNRIAIHKAGVFNVSPLEEVAVFNVDSLEQSD